MPDDGHDRPQLRVGIIGTGFSGLGTAIELLRKGRHRMSQRAQAPDVVLFERSHEVGGTWRDNTYPGCACDIPSQLYSFSCAPNPDWTRSYPLQAEIQRYLVDIADRYDLRRRIRFGTEITEARWDDRHRRWELATSTGDVELVDVLIAGTGPLSQPSIPDVAGLDDFRGVLFHSAAWRHDHDLSGRRVGVIGTGASAIQIVPEIAPVTERTVVFQRTPPWVLPRLDRELTDGERWLFRNVPLTQRLGRLGVYARQELLFRAFDAQSKAQATVRSMATKYIEQHVEDPELRRTVTPSYAVGCKRILISNDWYPALTRDDVDLVTDPIRRIVPEGVETGDGRLHEVDTLVLATGFRATDFLFPLKLYGRDGTLLDDAWRDRAATLNGISSAGFPNLFFVVGPNTGLGHNSIVSMIEAQCRYIRAAIDALGKRGASSIEARHDAQERFVAWADAELADSIWASGCSSWYLTEGGEKPRIDTLWPRSTMSYWLRTRLFAPGDYSFA